MQSMQDMKCPFCSYTYKLNWYDIPNSIVECCEDAKIRKMIYQADPTNDIFNKYLAVRVEEYHCGSNICSNIYPLIDSLFVDADINGITGEVTKKSVKLLNFYMDKTTIVHGYDITKMSMYLVPRIDHLYNITNPNKEINLFI